MTTKKQKRRRLRIIIIPTVLFLLAFAIFNFYENTNKLLNSRSSSDLTLLVSSHLKRFVVIPNTTFVPWKQSHGNMTRLPCIIDHEGRDFDPLDRRLQGKYSNKGILYIKIEKAASSTLAGIAYRISHAIANITNARITNHRGEVDAKRICRVRASHIWTRRGIAVNPLKRRKKRESFLFTFLKHPVTRCMSAFYYFPVSNNKTTPTDENAIEFLKDCSNGQMKKTSDRMLANVRKTRMTKQKVSVFNKEITVEKTVQETINEFDFIGVVERMDESLVMLQLMLDLRPSDVMSASSAKASGTYKKRRGVDECYIIPTAHISPGVQKFLDSETWREMNYADELLYEAAKVSLDNSIKAIGEEVFEDAMMKYRKAKTMVEEHCVSTVRDCTANGTFVPKEERDKCYSKDNGCGYECLDNLFHGG